MPQQISRNTDVTNSPIRGALQRNETTAALVEGLLTSGGVLPFASSGAVLGHYWKMIIKPAIDQKRIKARTYRGEGLTWLEVTPTPQRAQGKPKSANTLRIEALAPGEFCAMDPGTTRAAAYATALRVQERSAGKARFAVEKRGATIIVRRFVEGEDGEAINRKVRPFSMRQRIMQLQPGQSEPFMASEVSEVTLRNLASQVKVARGDGTHFRVSRCQGGYQVHCETPRDVAITAVVNRLRRLRTNQLISFQASEVTKAELANELRTLKAGTTYRYLLKEVGDELWVGCMPPGRVTPY